MYNWTFFLVKYHIFSNIEIYSNNKYNYNGVDKLFFSYITFIVFFLIPFEKSYSNILKLFIKILSKYTLGIYSLHPLISYYLRHFFKLKLTLGGCIIIYIVCYLISFAGEKLSFNTKIKFLFI